MLCPKKGGCPERRWVHCSVARARARRLVATRERPHAFGASIDRRLIAPSTLEAPRRFGSFSGPAARDVK